MNSLLGMMRQRAAGSVPSIAADSCTSTSDRNRAAWQLTALGLGLFGIVLLGPVLHRSAGDLAFNILGVAHGLLVLRAVQLAVRAEPRRALWIILGVGIALRLALLFEHPHLSSDVFRYVWDGRVQAAGINPYRFLPAAPELAWLRDAAVHPFINRADHAVTIYPPAAQMLFFVVGRIADGLVTMKLAFLAFEAVTVACLLDLLRRIGQPSSRIVVWAWHPLAVWEIAGNAHVDAAMVALMMVGVWMVAALHRTVAAAAVIALGAMMKPLAALALPFAWRPWDWRAPAVAIAVAALVYLPYLSVGTGVFSFVGGYLREERIEGGEGFWLVWLLSAAIGPIPWARTLYLAAVAALLGFLALRLSFAWEEGTEARLRRLSWLVFAGIMALSPNYPWYFLCVLPFVVLFGTAPFWAVTIACYVLYDEVWADPHLDFWVRDAAMHLAVLAALAATMPGKRRRLPPPDGDHHSNDGAIPARADAAGLSDADAGTPRTVAVAIICKTPTPGKSKTRLSPPLRPEECSEISACFITDLASTIDGERSRAEGYAVYTPVGSEPALRELLPARFGLVPQGEGDLGDRLFKGIGDLLEIGHRGAILVNSDSPTLPPEILRAAVAALDGTDRVVISPALDGGYTLIGLSRAHRRLFEDIPWSTDVVFRLTLERAREIGLPVVVLDGWYDVDDARSYAMLEAELDGGRPACADSATMLRDAPATRRFVERRRAMTERR